MRCDQRVAGETLRRLDCAEWFAVDGVEHPARRVDAFECVGHRQSGHHSAMSGEHGVDDCAKDAGRCERARGVVHEHDVGVATHRDTGTHRFRTVSTTGHNDGRRNEYSSMLHEIRGNDDDDLGVDVSVEDPMDTTLEDRRSAEVDECLGLVESESGTRSSRRDDDAGQRSAGCRRGPLGHVYQ